MQIRFMKPSQETLRLVYPLHPRAQLLPRAAANNNSSPSLVSTHPTDQINLNNLD